MASLNVHISGEMMAELRARASARGQSVDEVAEDALRQCLEEQTWQELLAYGGEKRRASGHSETEVPELVKEWRREQLER